MPFTNIQLRKNLYFVQMTDKTKLLKKKEKKKRFNIILLLSFCEV